MMSSKVSACVSQATRVSLPGLGANGDRGNKVWGVRVWMRDYGALSSRSHHIGSLRPFTASAYVSRFSHSVVIGRCLPCDLFTASSFYRPHLLTCHVALS